MGFAKPGLDFSSCYPCTECLDNKLESVGRALDPVGAALCDMGVDHRRLEVPMAEQFLNGADVGAGLEEVGREC